MLFKLLPILVLVAVAQCRSANTEDDTDTVFKQIFGEPPTKGSTDSPATATVDETCIMSNGSQGVCTEYYLCEDQPEDPPLEGILDIRGVTPPCPSYIEVCCSKKAKSMIILLPHDKQ